MLVFGAGQAMSVANLRLERMTVDRDCAICRWIWKNRRRRLCDLLVTVGFRRRFLDDARESDAAWRMRGVGV